MDPHLLALAAELSRRGEPFAVATVIRREAPSSAKVGDSALVTASGAFHGWLGGSGTRPTAVREALAAIADLVSQRRQCGPLHRARHARAPADRVRRLAHRAGGRPHRQGAGYTRSPSIPTPSRVVSGRRLGRRGPRGPPRRRDAAGRRVPALRHRGDPASETRRRYARRSPWTPRTSGWWQVASGWRRCATCCRVRKYRPGSSTASGARLGSISVRSRRRKSRESATVGAPPAIANAVVDAVAHLGVRHIDIPITPEKVWRILKEKGAAL